MGINLSENISEFLFLYFEKGKVMVLGRTLQGL
jgi:hypothetical protein